MVRSLVLMSSPDYTILLLNGFLEVILDLEGDKAANPKGQLWNKNGLHIRYLKSHMKKHMTSKYIKTSQKIIRWLSNSLDGINVRFSSGTGIIISCLRKQ